MSNIILFRFHNQPGICANRLRMLRELHPGVPIYGLYGGPAAEAGQYADLDLDHMYTIPIDDPYFKWLHADLCIRWWHRDVGVTIDWDMLYVVEWDMVYLSPLPALIPPVTEGVYVSYRQPIEPIKDTWTWTAPKRGRKEWEKLLAHLHELYGYEQQEFAGIFPGVAFSRAFLDRYLEEPEVPSMGNDELRTIAYTEAYGMMVHDTGLHDPVFYNAKKKFVPLDELENAAQSRHAFHPVKEPIPLSLFHSLRNN